MMLLATQYFWKFLDGCDPTYLDETAKALSQVLSKVMGEEYAWVQPNPDERGTIRRWASGCFTAPGEHKLIFPRVLFVFGPASRGNERWIADIFFTRIPHLRGLYSNKSTDHLVAPSVERELSVRLIESGLADVFTRSGKQTLVAKAAGAYVYQKVMHSASLKRQAERSKYVPPGSDLRELNDHVSGVLSEHGKHPPSWSFQIGAPNSGSS
ncbi:MAG: hypothetical protein L0Z53_20685 [Acidobacteriales bacterium]|nr:hypothetical protein [Terriglobales bacterium]